MLHSILLLAVAVADPRTASLSSPERQYFADQLQLVLQPLEDGLTAAGLQCALPDPARSNAGGLLNEVGTSAPATSRGYAPSSWSASFRCSSGGKSAYQVMVSLSAAPYWSPAGGKAPAESGPRWRLDESPSGGKGRVVRTLVIGAFSETNPADLPAPAHPPVLAAVTSAQITLIQEATASVAVPLLSAAPAAGMLAALDKAVALPAPASALTPVDQLPRPSLTPSERHYFAQQLERWAHAVAVAFAAEDLSCRPAARGGGPLDGGFDEDIPVRNTESRFGFAPSNWAATLKCAAPDGGSLTVTAGLSGAPEEVPTMPNRVLSRSDGGLVYQDMFGQATLLEVGQLVQADPDKLPPRAHPAALSRAVVGSVIIRGARGAGSPAPLLSGLALPPLQRALREAAALPAPRTDLPVPADAPRLASPPPAVAYPALTGPSPKPVAITLERADQEARLGQLLMVLGPEEQAYFVTLRAQAFAAAAAAMKTVHRDCEYVPPEREHPELPTEAELGPLGSEPREWGFGLRCYDPQTLEPLDLQVRLDPEWDATPFPDATYRRLAPDAVLQDSSFGKLRTTSLAVGKLGPIPPHRPTPEEMNAQLRHPPETVKITVVPGLMTLGAVELRALETENPHAEAVLAKVDLRALRLLLKHPPRPPSTRAFADEGAPVAGDRAALEAEIYRAVLDIELGPAPKAPQVVVDQALGGHSLGPTMPKLLRALCPDLLPSTFADYDQVMRQPGQFPASLTWLKPVVILSSEQRQALFSSHDGGGLAGGWEAYRQKYPGAAGIFSFSRIGLSRDGTQAIVAVSWLADALAGEGQIWVLRKVGGVWKLQYRSRQWIS